MSIRLGSFILGSASTALFYNFIKDQSLNISLSTKNCEYKGNDSLPPKLGTETCDDTQKATFNEVNHEESKDNNNSVIISNTFAEDPHYEKVDILVNDTEIFDEYLRPFLISQEVNIPKYAKILADGLPSYDNLSFYEGFICSHDLEKKIPRWTIHELRREDMKTSNADRRFSYFNSKLPGNIPNHCKALNDDYLRSGYSRGHLVPASDAKFKSQDALDDTFLLNSNIVPQEYNNNANYWYQMENLGRTKLGMQFKSVRILSGPLFLPTFRDVNGKLKEYKNYELIGKNKVAVPTHLFKVFLCEPEGDLDEITQKKKNSNLLAAFVVPNESIPMDTPLTEFQVPPSFIEKHASLSIYPLLKEREGFEDLCKSNPENCSLLIGDEWKIHDLRRRLFWNYKDEAKLIEVYEQLKEMGGVDDGIESLFQKTLEEIKLTKKYQKTILNEPNLTSESIKESN